MTDHLGLSGVCGHTVHWWDDHDNCDRRAGHEGPHAVVGSGLRWTDNGDQVLPVGADHESTPRGRCGASHDR